MAAGDGLVSMTPTSIAHSGTSASINADGGVDFVLVSEISLNGVFTSDYDNYVIFYRAPDAGSDDSIAFRLRLSGSDASGTDYTEQRLRAAATVASGQRATSQTRGRVGSTIAPMSGFTTHIYGPALAEPTAYRCVTVDGSSGGRIDDYAGTHSLSTAYDGITFFSLGGGVQQSGMVHVFGYEE